MPTKQAEIKIDKTNYYYNLNKDYYLILINLLQSAGPTKYLNILKNEKYHDLINWVNYVTPKLNSSDYKLQTKLHWIVHNLQDFPICLQCGTRILKNTSPFLVPYQYCSVSCQRHSKIRQQNALNTTEQRYGDPYYNNREQAQKTSLLKYGTPNNMQSELGMAEYRAAMQKKYGVNYTWEIPEVQEKANNIFLEKYGVIRASKLESVKIKQEITNFEKYGCKCPLQNDIIHQKAVNTLQQVYNCDHPSKSAEIQARARSKYLYNLIYFDSAPELAYYIWLIDHHINFLYKPKNQTIEYFDSLNVKHVYFPDFYLIDTNQIIELKGDNHFKNGKLINISNSSLNYIAEAKQQCMEKHNVIIYTSIEYNKYLEYINSIYGKNYLKQFKVKRI